MVMDLDYPTDDFWSIREPAGTASTWIFHGADGLRRLSAAASFSAPIPSRFRARLTRVQLDNIALEGFAATAHTSRRTPALTVAHPTPVLSFVFLQAGEMQVELKDETFEIRSGEFLIVDSRDPVALTADSEVRVLTSVIGLEHLPAHLRRRGTTIAAAVPRTPLVDSFVAFQATVLSSSMGGRMLEGTQLIRAVAELHSAVLAEAQHLVGEPTGPAALRVQMEEYIDAHLGDTDLNPQTIAAAMGISLRHAHNVFNSGERTIARYIRDRRLEAVAFSLRTSTDQLPLTDLTSHYGFASVAMMRRAFRDRFGMSPGEYRAGGHRTSG
jgi:AraC-like DNA-binding protein